VALSLTQRFPLIVSNPPYIPTPDIAGLDRDVRDFDPHLALDGGSDGLDVYRSIAQHLKTVAAPGWLVLEIGNGQAIDLSKIMLSSPLCARIGQPCILPDMAGMQRCVTFEIRE
jgi:release factor glutamine methyltransferase